MFSRLRRLARRARIQWSQLVPAPAARQQVFARIYREGSWGSSGVAGDFDSGTGSHCDEITGPYVKNVQEFIRCRWKKSAPRIVDLGCGDFGVGAQLAGSGSDYVGVDIVPALVEGNRQLHGKAHVQFECRDIVIDSLPQGDLCLVRQVFQHLSNDDIAAVIPKLEQYEEVLITEHLPSPGRIGIMNRDKRTGPEIRLYWASGVFLQAPPFSIPESNLTELFRVPGHSVEPGGDPGVLVTMRLSRNPR